MTRYELSISVSEKTGEVEVHGRTMVDPETFKNDDPATVTARNHELHLAELVEKCLLERFKSAKEIEGKILSGEMKFDLKDIIGRVK